MRCLLSILVCLPMLVNGQLVLGRQVIGAAAINTATISTTMGEVGAQTSAGETLQLTAGFEQPAVLNVFDAIATVGYLDCWNGQNAFVQLQTNSDCGAITLSVLNGDVQEDPNNLSEGSYLVQVETEEGCSWEQEIIVLAPNLLPCDLFLPNTFTPNNDQVNDSWIIDGIFQEEYQDNTVRIHDRWGQLVWEANGYDNVSTVWTGQNSDGTDLPDGTYFFELTLNVGDPVRGHINIIR